MPDLEQLDELRRTRERLSACLAERIVGLKPSIMGMLTAIFAGGHAILIGAPGLAKTLLVRSVAEALGWRFKRIQFTPDLMPSDVTGTEVLRQNQETGERELAFIKGPVFANLILADEINRTPPKTQAALLQAMQEGAVTAGRTTHELPKPFFVLATQNPIEQEGTYRLPEAQLDRFLLSVSVDYPNPEDEMRIAMLDVRHVPEIQPVLSLEQFAEHADLVARLPVPEVVTRYAVELARGSRPTSNGDEWIRENVAWGAGPRATQHLIAAARAWAALEGKPAVDVATIRTVAYLVFSHRLVPSFQAAGSGIGGKEIVQHLLESVSA